MIEYLCWVGSSVWYLQNSEISIKWCIYTLHDFSYEKSYAIAKRYMYIVLLYNPSLPAVNTMRTSAFVYIHGTFALTHKGFD